MDLKELEQFIADLDALLREIEQAISEEEKGGPGSGCSGDNCGRPRTGEDKPKPSGRITDPSNDKPITVTDNNDIVKPEREKPRSGVRPSAINPNRREIEYSEESGPNRPRSGVRPSKPKK